jgi:biotin carboxylase
VWRRFPGLEVRFARTRLELLRESLGRPSFVLPLWAAESLRCPPWWWMLRPNRRAIAALDGKLDFARYVRSIGLADLLPRAFLPGEAPSFPLVLKPSHGTNGRDVRFIDGPDALAQALADPRWRRWQPVLQERIAGETDCVTHAVCVGGHIIGHLSYRHHLGPSEVQSLETIVHSEPWTAGATELDAFAQLLGPLGYDGPASIDWRRRPDGRLVVFEINTRLGGSLMRPDREADLAGMLRLILQHARPPRLFD